MNFPKIRVNGTTITKVGKYWSKESGDGELYPVVGQKEAQRMYEEVEGMKSRDNT